MSTIPADHLIDPRVGKVGFFGPPTPYGPPEAWERQHHVAEGGGYLRVGRRWQVSDLIVAIRCVPTSLLYRPLFARIGGAAGYQQGWTVDA